MKFRYVIYHGNAKDALKKIPSNSIDLVFTSPPYWTMKDSIQWSSYDKYISEMEEIVAELKRVVKFGRIVAINITDYIDDGERMDLIWEWHRMLKDAGLMYRDWIIWRKSGVAFGSNASKMASNFVRQRLPMYYSPNRVFELILVFSKGKIIIPRYNNIITELSRVKIEREYLDGIWEINPRSDPDHPAVFPYKLAELVILYYSYYGETVLDPFLGSGTTMEVAFKHGRSCIGCEINSKYVEIAKRRVGFGQKFITDEHDVEYEVIECI